jgi:hypothetical protein
MLLQRQSGFLQVESTINKFCGQLIWDSKKKTGIQYVTIDTSKIHLK